MASSSNVRRNLLSVHHIPAFWPLCVGAVGGLSAYWVMNFAFPVEEDPTVNALQAQVGSYKTLTDRLRTNLCNNTLGAASKRTPVADTLALSRQWKVAGATGAGDDRFSSVTACRAIEGLSTDALVWMVGADGNVFGARRIEYAR